MLGAMTMPLPEEFQYGHVAGRFALAVADTAGDADALPELRAMTGSISLIPAIEQVVSVSGDPTLIVKTTMSFGLDAQGYLVDAHGNKTVTVPTGVYTVSYSLKEAPRRPSHQIEVTTEHTAEAPFWLPYHQPYVPPAGVTVQTMALPPGADLGEVLGWTESGLRWVPGASGGGTSGTVIKRGGTQPSSGLWLDDGTLDPDGTAPSTPTGLTATATGSATVNLSWNASTDNIGVTGYNYRIGTGAAVDAGAGTTEAVTGLSPLTAYSFQVQAYDAQGNVSGWSAAANVTTLAGPDTTAPTPGTLAASAITSTAFTLTVTGASDAVGLHATPYAFSTDNGTTWSAWQAGATYNVTGRTPSTGYQARHRVRDAAGNVATGTAITVTTSAPAPVLVEDFTAADGTSVAGRTINGYTWQLDSTKMTHLGAPGVTSTIQSGKAVSSASSRTSAVLDTGLNKARVSFDYTVGAGAELRFVAAASTPSGSDGINGFRFQANGAGAVTLSVGFGTGPNVISSQTGQALSATIVLEFDRNTITAYRNGVQFATAPFPYNDNSALVQPSGTHIGFTFSNHAGSSVDNITVTPL